MNNKVGFSTKDELVYLGIGKDGCYKYSKNCGLMKWHQATCLLDEINRTEIYQRTAGVARFPTGWDSDSDELHNNFYLNRHQIINLVKDGDAIWGAKYINGLVQVEVLGDNIDWQNYNRHELVEVAILCPIWSTKKLIP